MDTISRESNTSILPIAGIIAGLVALILAVVALVKLSAANTAISSLKDDLGSRVASIESQVTTAVNTAEKAQSYANKIERETQGAFQAVAAEVGAVRGEINTLKESLTKPKVVAAGPGGKTPKEPAVAGPNEYIVKPGDSSGTKIAKANGVSIEDLKSVNPSVNWNKLKIGDKLKLPRK